MTSMDLSLDDLIAQRKKQGPARRERRKPAASKKPYARPIQSRIGSATEGTHLLLGNLDYNVTDNDLKVSPFRMV